MRSGCRSTCASAPRRERGGSIASAFVVAVLVVTGTVVPRAAAGVDEQRQRVAQIADQLADLENRIGQLEEDHAAALDRIDQLAVEIADSQARIDAQSVVLAQLQG